MLEKDAVQDLLRCRAQMYQGFCSVEKAIAGFSGEKLVDLIVDTLINFPVVSVNLPEGCDKEFADEAGFSCQGDHLALPFKRLSILNTADNETNLVLLVRVTDNQVLACSFDKYNREKSWSIGIPIVIEEAGNFTLRGSYSEGFGKFNSTQVELMLGSVGYQLAFINSTKRLLVRELYKKEASLSAHEICKRKVPPWEYHEVELSSLPGYIYIPKGGTHASPRWHMRRGHWRNYKSGKRVWVEQMEVGDKSKGVIVKDYVVTNHLGVSK